MRLFQITAPYFCAGFEVRDGLVRRAAPILRYMLGWDGRRVRDYCDRKRWRLAEVQP